jgi:phosphoserine aminotransferase
MVPMNLLPGSASADYILTDQWSQKALKEAQIVAKERGAQARVSATTESENFARIPQTAEIETDGKAIYAHFTSNNTLFGTQWQSEPETGSVPLVADASSDILSRPLNIEKYGLLYAGAQKNMGPGGVTLVVVRDDMLKNVPSGLATMLDYRTHAKARSLYNTPNTWGVYVVDLVAKWLQELGGLAAMQQLNEAKASELYAAIDATDFYRGHAHPGSRSRMNVTFRCQAKPWKKSSFRQQLPKVWTD